MTIDGHGHPGTLTDTNTLEIIKKEAGLPQYPRRPANRLLFPDKASGTLAARTAAVPAALSGRRGRYTVSAFAGGVDGPARLDVLCECSFNPLKIACRFWFGSALLRPEGWSV